MKLNILFQLCTSACGHAPADVVEATPKGAAYFAAICTSVLNRHEKTQQSTTNHTLLNIRMHARGHPPRAVPIAREP